MKNFGPISEKVTELLHGGDYNPDQWLDMPEILGEDVRLMKISGINTVSVGIFSWSALEPREGEYNFGWLDEIMDSMYENGVYVILATPSGAKPAWMAKKYPEVLRVDDTGRRNKYGQRHNHCPTSPVYRQKVQEMNSRLAERYKNHPALTMWHISNEFEGECHCELCQNAFREWLKAKYDNDLGKLNKAWWCAFWSHTYSDWDEIEAPSKIGEKKLHGLNLDWKRFTTDQMIDYCSHESRILKEITPDIPVTTNFHEFMNALDFDYFKFAKAIDVISWDNYPYWHQSDDVDEGSRRAFIHDMNRSFKNGKPFMMMESAPSATNWQGVAKLRRPGMHRVQSLQAVAHGSDTVQYFQIRKSRGSYEKFHGAVIDHCGHENTRVFREVADVGETLKKLKEVVGTSVEPEAAVIFDWENAWALDDAKGPGLDTKSYWETCHSHYKGLWLNSIPVDVINEDCDFSKYKLIIAPALYMIRKGVGERLTKFVQNGGTLVTTYWSGIVNESDLCFLGGFPGPVKEAAGIWAEELDTLYGGETVDVKIDAPDLKLAGDYKAETFCDLIHTEGATALGTYESEFYKGMPALTYNRFGSGGVYYIAFKSADDFLNDFYTRLAADLELKRAIDMDLPYGVNAQVRYDENHTFVFLMNYTPDKKHVEIPEGRYLDAETGRPIDHLDFETYGVRILKAMG